MRNERPPLHDKDLTTRPEPTIPGSDRREFLKRICAGAGAVGVLTNFKVDAATSLTEVSAASSSQPYSRSKTRSEEAFQIRLRAAKRHKAVVIRPNPTNGDETLYDNFVASFSKGLPHNELGEVELSAYRALLKAIRRNRPALFEKVPLGEQAKLANPLAAVAFQLEGSDPQAYTIPTPPSFASEEQGAELAENYWFALIRDVPFADYGASELIDRALKDLTRFPLFADTTVSTVFRGATASDSIGPPISQFLWVEVPYGLGTITQKYSFPLTGQDFLADYAEWLSVQNGTALTQNPQFDSTPRYIHNLRGLAEWVHQDFPCQSFLNAALILLKYGADALDDANPYKSYRKQSAFATFGSPDILDMVSRVAVYALKASWYQKWSVHRRLRPEAYAGHVHNLITRQAAYPVHATLLNSDAVATIYQKCGGYLLPLAYPEGCPLHPSYPAGHAVIAGACATILKAYFNEDYPIRDPKIPADDGSALIDYRDADLTIGGELDKLASNVARGRDAAGVHWRSDGIAGLRLGEAVALSLLADCRSTYRERFRGFSLNTFDGLPVRL